MKLSIRISLATLSMAAAHGAESPGPSEAPPPIPAFSISYMNQSVSPGADFYHYADGNWNKNNPLPADKARWASFNQLADRNWYLIHGILDSATADTTSPP